MSVEQLTKAGERLFGLLDVELSKSDVIGELCLVGGAVMCLALDARDATHDVDALFKPATEVRKAAVRVARRASVSADWLNDAVKGFLSPRGTYVPYLELSHLRVFTAEPHYLLAMKCVALRIGAEFHDVSDVRYLLRYLNITRAKDALEIVLRYFDEKQIPAKTRLALEEMLGEA